MSVNTLQEKIPFPDLEKIVVFKNSYMAWTVLIVYIAFSKFIGPAIMKNRRPLELKWLMILYNTALVVSNVFLSVKLIQLVYIMWPYRCDFRNSPVYKDIEKYSFIGVTGYLVKCAELLDTVFFILRKKNNQVSFLHVFHHSMVYILVWACLKKNLLTFNVILVGSINCPVHVLLYLYYGLAALGPSVRKYLWWKKYLTKLQIMQFFILIIYMFFAFLTGCEKFRSFEIVYFTSLVIITALFFNFYNQEYKSK